MNITGYCSDNTVIGYAIEKDNSILRFLEEISNELNIIILGGFAEKDSGDRIYASHIVLIPGKKPDLYRKLHVAPPEKETFTAGSSATVFDAGNFRFGIQLCYDAHFPELATLMTEKGVDAIFIPHASPRLTPYEKCDSWMRHLPARAFDNSIYIIACNQNGNNSNGLNFPGLSVVIDPSGKVVDRNLSGEENILYADLKKEVIENIRGHKMKYFFSNRRKFL